jgi:hypothetical protein
MNKIAFASLILLLQDEEDDNEGGSWKLRALTSEGRQRMDRRYPRASLRRYRESPLKQKPNIKSTRIHI